jgi:hypothetical protein
MSSDVCQYNGYPFDNLRKKGAMIQKANVNRGRQRWTRWREGESYPVFVFQGGCIEVESFMVRRQCRWKEKVIKKQRRSNEKDGDRLE